MSQTNIIHSGGPVDPPSGVTYPLVLRPTTAFQTFAGIAAALAGFVLAVRLIAEIVLRIGFQFRGGDYGLYASEALAYKFPEGLLAGHLGLAMLTVVALLIARYLHGRSPKWMFSVQPGMRWRYLLATFIVAAVILNAMLWLSFTWDGMPRFNAGQEGAIWFLLIVVFSSPLQALAEEVFFRGYLMQAIGGISNSAWIGIIGSALVFALMHGTQNPALFVHRFAFGIVAGLLVVRTGGLEAAIAAHVVNNLGAFLYAIFTTSVAEARAIQEITWAKAAWDITTFTLFALAAWWLSRRMQLATTTP